MCWNKEVGLCTDSRTAPRKSLYQTSFEIDQIKRRVSGAKYSREGTAVESLQGYIARASTSV